MEELDLKERSKAPLSWINGSWKEAKQSQLRQTETRAAQGLFMKATGGLPGPGPEDR